MYARWLESDFSSAHGPWLFTDKASYHMFCCLQDESEMLSDLSVLQQPQISPYEARVAFTMGKRSRQATTMIRRQQSRLSACLIRKPPIS